MDAYVEGRLSGARLDYVRAHLDACEACRAELEDLRTFKASAVGLSQASSLKRELERRKRQRQLKAAATAAIAAAVVAVIGVVGWNKFGKAWVHTASAPQRLPHGRQLLLLLRTRKWQARRRRINQTAIKAPQRRRYTTSRSSGAQPRATPMAQPRGNAVASTQTSACGAIASARNCHVAAARAGARCECGSRSTRATARHGLAVAGTARLSSQRRRTSAAAAAVAPGSTSFALLGPFGDEVSDDRPEFAWQPLEGATKYSIIIVDEGLRPIAHTRLKTTTWRPHKPLRRGRTYLWQVTAILKNGTKVMATGPTSQEARIHITAPSK